MSEQDFKGMFELRKFLEENCSATTVSSVCKIIEQLLHADATEKCGYYTPNFTATFHEQQLTILIKDDLLNILTEVVLVKVGKSPNVLYAEHYADWKSVPKKKYIGTSIIKLDRILTDLSHYFDERKIESVRKHARAGENKKSPSTFDITYKDQGLVIEKTSADGLSVTIALPALKGHIYDAKTSQSRSTASVE